MDEATLEQVRAAIQKGLDGGKSLDEVKDFMKQTGFSDADIEEAISGMTPATPEPIPAPEPEPVSEPEPVFTPKPTPITTSSTPSQSSSNKNLMIIGAIVVIAIIAYFMTQGGGPAAPGAPGTTSAIPGVPGSPSSPTAPGGVPSDSSLICKISSPYKAHYAIVAYELTGIAAIAKAVMEGVGGPEVPNADATLFDNLGITLAEFKANPDLIKSIFRGELERDIQAHLDSSYTEVWYSWDSQDNVYMRTVEIRPGSPLSVMTLGGEMDAIGDWISGGSTSMSVMLTVEKGKRHFASVDETGGCGMTLSCLDQYKVGTRNSYDFTSTLSSNQPRTANRLWCDSDDESDIGLGYEMELYGTSIMSDAVELERKDAGVIDLYRTLKKGDTLTSEIDTVLEDGTMKTWNGVQCIRGISREDESRFWDSCFSQDECMLMYEGKLDGSSSILSSVGYIEVLEVSHEDFSASIFDVSGEDCTERDSPVVKDPSLILEYIPDFEEIYARYIEHLEDVPMVLAKVPTSISTE